MSEVSERYATVAQGFQVKLEAVGSHQWSDPTPCAEWTVRELASHVVGTQRRVRATLEEAPASPLDQDADLVAAFREARASIEEALADPARSARTVSGMFGEQPFESLVGRLVCSDTLIHTWDLARATGQDEHLDDGAVARCTEFLGQIDEAIRRPGGFAPKIAPAPGADEQTKLLNFAGRTV